MAHEPTNRDMLGITRAMAWERAKGEMNSIMKTYIGEYEKAKKMDDAIKSFIQMIEENGLAE